ncbi:MAG: hypothetical protein A2Y77_07520 [Planctomycetes bacterium RBG_13_62_9]|nr:MAG: hypothetical protein A2Y77_07520 [Planctomycetes bacterium RBG_13_62_9]
MYKDRPARQEKNTGRIAGRMDEAIPAYRRFIELANARVAMPADSRYGQMAGSVSRTMIWYIQEQIDKYEGRAS